MSLTTYFTSHLVVTVDQVVGEVIVGGTCNTQFMYLIKQLLELGTDVGKILDYGGKLDS